MDDCLITGSEWGVFNGFDFEIFNSEVSGNVGGIHSRWPSEIRGCKIGDNSDVGVLMADYGINVFTSTIVRNRVGVAPPAGRGESYVFRDNMLCSNTDFDLQLGSQYSVDATNNWWCTTDPDVIVTGIWDVYDDSNLGQVTFEPFLTEPPPDAPQP